MSTRALQRALLISLLLSGCGGDGIPQAPTSPDSDGDGLDDDTEREAPASNPFDPDDPVRWGNRDHDGDGLPNGVDADYHPDDDPDGDGLDNATEYRHDRDPATADWVVSVERPFATLTPQPEVIEVVLRTPGGQPLALEPVTHIVTPDASSLAVYAPAKGWISDDDGRFVAEIGALGGTTGTIKLVRGRTGETVTLGPFESANQISTHNPPDTERGFSSIEGGDEPGRGFGRSTLGDPGGWMADDLSDPWLDIPVPEGQRVTALWVQGSATLWQWVESLQVSAELAPGWRVFARGGESIPASTDRSTAVRLPLDLPSGLDAIRIHPQTWRSKPVLRAAIETIPHTPTQPLGPDGLPANVAEALQAVGVPVNGAALVQPAGSALGQAREDSGDGIARPWYAHPLATAPWIELEVPAGRRLIGLRWSLAPGSVPPTALRLDDTSPPGLLTPLIESHPTPAGATNSLTRWLPGASAVRRVRLTATQGDGPNAAPIGGTVALWTTPLVPTDAGNLDDDADEDGLRGIEEIARGLDPELADSDGDGLLDGVEDAGATDPQRADSDGDGLDDALEQRAGTDPTRAAAGGELDQDDDTLSDAFERELLGTDPQRADTDSDGLDDATELAVTRTDPRRADTDGDTLSDAEETDLGSDPLLQASPVIAPLLDADGDGLNNAREHWLGTGAERADSDGDGLEDAVELSAQSDPLDPDAPYAGGALDTDGDGLPDGFERYNNTDQNDGNDPVQGGAEDLDGDGRVNGTDPDYLGDTDYDGDGRDNADEYRDGSDPIDPDSPLIAGDADRDQDGVPDGVDPDAPPVVGIDSDADGLDDASELRAGSDPDDPQSPSVGGAADLDGDGVPNNTDPDYRLDDDADGDGWSNAVEYRAGTDPAVANTAADFATVDLLAGSTATGPLRRYTLPAPNNGTPYYSHDPASLAALTSGPSQAILRDHADGIDGAPLIDLRDGTVWLVNNSPRTFKDLPLLVAGEALPRRLDSTLKPFSERPLTVSGAALAMATLGTQQLDPFKQLDDGAAPTPVPPGLIDDAQHLALRWQRRFTDPAWWAASNAALETALTSGCGEPLCDDPAAGRVLFESLLGPGTPVMFGGSNAPNRGPGWQSQDLGALDSTDQYGAQQLRARGLEDDGLVALFAPANTPPEIATLARETRLNRPTTEHPDSVWYTVDATDQRLVLHWAHRDVLAAVWVFSPAGGAPLALTWRGSEVGLSIDLSASQWAEKRLWVIGERSDGGPGPAAALRW